MDDLISRKAAIEAVKIPNGEYPNPSERHGIIIARVEARRAIQSIPSVPAVPLDKLCEWLADYMFSNDCAKDDMLETPDFWREEITKWMEERNENK